MAKRVFTIQDLHRWEKTELHYKFAGKEGTREGWKTIPPIAMPGRCACFSHTSAVPQPFLHVTEKTKSTKVPSINALGSPKSVSSSSCFSRNNDHNGAVDTSSFSIVASAMVLMSSCTSKWNSCIWTDIEKEAIRVSETTTHSSMLNILGTYNIHLITIGSFTHRSTFSAGHVDDQLIKTVLLHSRRQSHHQIRSATSSTSFR